MEPLVPWSDPVYPEERGEEETPSPTDEEESGSEFVPSDSVSD
jgi:hypothetical protein